MGALDQAMASNIMNATLPTGTGGVPGSFTALTNAAMKMRLNSTLSTAATASYGTLTAATASYGTLTAATALGAPPGILDESAGLVLDQAGNPVLDQAGD